MNGMSVIRVDFDNMENSSAAAISATVLATFIGDDKLSAHGKAEQFIERMSPTGRVLGWDGQVYPQIRVEPCEIK